MQSIEFKESHYKNGERILLAGFFLAAFLLCGLISYTDGDDAYFSKMANSMGFFEYIKMRYIGWEGRVTSEAMTYINFYLGKTFWQFANAAVLTLLPVGLIHMTKKMVPPVTARNGFYLAVTAYAGILLLDMSVLGYGAFWITGSVFYLWSIVAGLWAAMPFVDLAYRRELPDKKSFFYALPCALIAAMGQEQIAAVVIAFGLLSVLYYLWRERRIPWLALAQTVLMIGALILLFLSPGTDARSRSEIETWMPQFASMSLGNHIFITVQWVLSSLANEGKALFLGIWILGAFLLMKRNKSLGAKITAGLAGVFSAVSLLPVLGITWFSDMGMGIGDPAECVTRVATPGTVSGLNWLAMGWWFLACLFTLGLLWQIGETSKEKAVFALLFLAAFASECIMYFSPTMYASGGRVYFVAQILLWLILLLLYGRHEGERKRALFLLLCGLGILHFVVQIPYLLAFF